MSPPKAKIFLVEDDTYSAEIAGEFLRRSGHEIVESASTLKEALNKIPMLGVKGVNVAIVDGNLDESEDRGFDGEKISKEIKAGYGEKIIVIGHALNKPIQNADINSVKADGGSSLVKKVTES